MDGQSSPDRDILVPVSMAAALSAAIIAGQRGYPDSASTSWWSFLIRT
jgi:hypothetical protein